MALVGQRRAHVRPQRSPARARLRRPRRRVAAKPLPPQHSQRGARGRASAAARAHARTLGAAAGAARALSDMPLNAELSAAMAARVGACLGRALAARTPRRRPVRAPRAATRPFFFARPRADRAPRACECILMICDAFFSFFLALGRVHRSRRSRPGHHRARASPAGGLT